MAKFLRQENAIKYYDAIYNALINDFVILLFIGDTFKSLN